MDDLIAFLNARLDEDERYLKSNAHHLWTQRPFREVEAGRGLLDLYERAKRYRDEIWAFPSPRRVSDEMRAVTQMMALEQVLRLRVAVYSDHPDYRQEWES